MKKVAILLGLCMLAGGLLAAESWTGYITDEKCAGAGRSGDKHAGCAERCIKGGSSAVLVTDGEGKVVKIANQDKVKEHAGHHVTVTGKLEKDTLTVETVQMVEEKK